MLRYTKIIPKVTKDEKLTMAITKLENFNPCIVINISSLDCPKGMSCPDCPYYNKNAKYAL